MNKLSAILSLTAAEHTPVEVSFQTTPLDAVRFNLYHIPRLRFIQIMISLLVAAQAILMLPRVMSPIASLEDRLLAAGLLAMGIVVLIALLIVGISFLATLPFRNGETDNLCTVRVTGGGVDESCRAFRRHYAWSDIFAVKENGGHVYLYTGRHTAIVIPKRAFINDRECSIFTAFAREQWSFRRRLPVAA